MQRSAINPIDFMDQRDGVSVPLWLLSQSGTLTPSLCSNPVPLFHNSFRAVC
ncbi:MAG: hypothetical protein FWE41_06935 [Coriobacteriia bacterium]|nr:hypothetical protein [Coriobacteriia bacterium]MCL2750894.1 hypothetical protein [Coriobacteriia bacterium]